MKITKQKLIFAGILLPLSVLLADTERLDSNRPSPAGIAIVEDRSEVVRSREVAPGIEIAKPANLGRIERSDTISFRAGGPEPELDDQTVDEFPVRGRILIMGPPLELVPPVRVIPDNAKLGEERVAPGRPPEPVVIPETLQ